VVPVSYFYQKPLDYNAIEDIEMFIENIDKINFWGLFKN
jgi:hypothetical protein